MAVVWSSSAGGVAAVPPYAAASVNSARRRARGSSTGMARVGVIRQVDQQQDRAPAWIGPLDAEPAVRFAFAADARQVLACVRERRRVARSAISPGEAQHRAMRGALQARPVDARALEGLRRLRIGPCRRARARRRGARTRGGGRADRLGQRRVGVAGEVEERRLLARQLLAHEQQRHAGARTAAAAAASRRASARDQLVQALAARAVRRPDRGSG